jgi:hypothetical protein
MPPPITITLEEYLRRITAEHNQRPRFMATVELSVQPYVDGVNAALELIGLFDLDTAVGEQLDMLGQWVGITRFVSIDTEVWFSFDAKPAHIGFDQGKWSNPYETARETVRLDDFHYRILLRARIASNQWDGTIPGAYQAWGTLLEGTGYQILIQDGLARAERDFSFDGPPGWGFDQALWYEVPPLAAIYFSFDAEDLTLGLDQGFWYGPPGTALTQPWARTNGNMHLIEALLGPPMDALTRALFTGGYLTLKSAGVQIDYMIQGQGTGPGELPDDSTDGIGRPLFAFDVGPGDKGYWMEYDRAGAGLDEAPLFYPGAHPIDPDFAPTYLTLDGNDPDSGLDKGWWTGPVRPSYLVLDADDAMFSPPELAHYFSFDIPLGFDEGTWRPAHSGAPVSGAALEHGLDAGEWYSPGQYWPPQWDPDQLPPTGVTWPPTPLAGFDLGAFGQTLTPVV